MSLSEFQKLTRLKKDFALIYYELALDSGTNLDTTVKICNSNKMLFCIPFMKIFIIANYNKIYKILSKIMKWFS